MYLNFIAYPFLFILGACVGSFLNVISDRLESGKSIIFGRSHCESCKNKLYARDLIPVFSFLFLKGRCRYCKEKLSYTYLVSELLTGFIFVYTGIYLIKVGYMKNIMFPIITGTLYAIISSFIISSFFWFLIFITKGRGMGFGDVKLGFLIGLFNGWPNNILAIFLGFLTGAVFSLILILFGKKGMKDTIAFGPFLILGSFISFFWGSQIVRWYLG